MYSGCKDVLSKADAVCGPPREDATYRACLQTLHLDTQPPDCSAHPAAHRVRCDAAGHSTHVHGCSTRDATRETVYGTLRGGPSYVVMEDATAASAHSPRT